jgi:hypothetical protein
VNVDDQPGPDSDRAYFERNVIALISNYSKTSIDSRDDEWLGNESPRDEISQSGLWNINHVAEGYDSAFLERLSGATRSTTPP